MSSRILIGREGRQVMELYDVVLKLHPGHETAGSIQP